MAFLILTYVIIWAMREKRTQIVLWTLATALGLTIISLFILPGWPLMWLRQLVSYPSYTEIGSPLSIMLSGLPDQWALANWIVGGALLAYLFLEWVLSLGKGDAGFQWTAALTLVVTNLIAFRTATTNFVVMFPALILIFHSWSQRWGRRGVSVVWIISFGLLAGLWWLFLVTVDGNMEAPIMYLPLPVFILAGLIWSRWWIFSAARQPLRGF